MNKGGKDCYGLEFNVNNNNNNKCDDLMKSFKNMGETKSDAYRMTRYDSFPEHPPEDEFCDDDEDDESVECVTMVPGSQRNPKEEAKIRKQKEKEANKKRKQLVKECKKKAKDIEKEYKKKEKERQKKEKERMKKIKEYEKKKLKQEKQCKKERDKCEKEKEKDRKQKEKEKLKRLKEKMKIKCESLKYAHQNENDCDDDNLDECCQRASAKINNINKNSSVSRPRR
ncbi:hypothetical protein M8J76_004179 [Diaphorina citri]|nr:hypothetical protein M8J76_004179 [Diaphorina citri]